nr:unnamed protein product [Callosobruchus analis]
MDDHRQNKSYSSAWVNGVSVRSNFTQTILDHEKSEQHISASLSYNNWLQGNIIDTLLKSEIDSKITFWRDVLHRIINVIITLVSCNLPLRGHDSDSGKFMAISRLLTNYDATLKGLLLKPKDRQNKSYSSAWVNGVSVRSNFTQTILDHEKSEQHISASLSYNNWLQGNTIDTLLKISCNLPLRGHDSDSGNFMAISRLLTD